LRSLKDISSRGREFRRYWRYLRRVPSPYWASRLQKSDVRPRNVKYNRSNKSVRLLPLDVELPRDASFDFLIGGYRDAVSLAERCGASFSILDDRSILVEIDSNLNAVETAEEFFILKEIYVSGDYDISLPGEVVFLDIGMNVGFSSIYLASRNSGARVVSYEPSKRSFLQAEKNIGLNPALSERITAHNWAVGARNTTAELRIPGDLFGSATVSGDLSMTHKRHLPVESETVEVRDICDCLSDVKDAHPGYRIAAKMDCEGAEYEIVDRLIESGRIAELGLIAMEWHDTVPGRDHRALVDSLEGNGFSCTVQSTYPKYGMIYATNELER
jgi:FkbM family methyltransferase